MYLTTLDPFTRDFDRIVRRAFGTGFGQASSTALPMDTVRRDGELVLRFDVPGVDPEKIDVTVDRERLFGSFRRSIRLAENLDADSIEASNNDGVLEIRIPVREEAKPRKIEVGSTKELAS